MGRQRRRSKKAQLWNQYQRHFGSAGDPAILVAKGASRNFNPTLPQAIELRRRDGDWAGALLAWPPAGSFASQQTRIGRDGTVVQLLSRALAAGPQCVYRWWPGVLRSGVNGDGTSVCVAGSCP